MSRLTLFASVALLVLTPPLFAQGNGHGGGGKGGEGRGAHQGGGGKPDRGGDRHGPRADRGSDRKDMSADRGRGHDRGPRAQRDSIRGNADAHGPGNQRHARRDFAGPDRKLNGPPGAAVRHADNVRDLRHGRDHVQGRVVDRGRYVRRASFLNGCPPGLAKKHNGCLPPGQAKKFVSNDRMSLYRYDPWYGEALRGNWGYWHGYAYRVDPVTAVASAFLPLLGGALYPRAVWPVTYVDYAPDPYYVRYYGYDDDFDYRYANGALFAVDPRNNEIEAVAALLAGDPWLVGRPVPVGYDIYNVPPPYRARYYDGPDAWYRYSDGYVYRIDPTTQLVVAAIQLLA